MSLTLQKNPSLQNNTATAIEIRVAQMSKKQQTKEGKMAIKLLESAKIEPQIASQSGAVGATINIKV